MFGTLIGLSHFAHALAKIIGACVGLLLLYFGAFLYEDEKGRIQNNLEKWWIQISDQQNIAVSRTVLFIRVVASLATKVFDRLFGNKILSVRAIGGSICFSLTSWLLVDIVVFFHLRADADLWDSILAQAPWFRWVLPISILGVVVYLCLGLLSFRFAKPWAVRAWFAAVLLLAPLAPLCFFYADRSDEGLGDIPLLWMSSWLVAVLVASCLCDIFFVALTRLMLRKVVSKSSFANMIALILLNCLMASLLVIAPFLAARYISTEPSFSGDWPFLFLGLLSRLNLFDGLVSLVFVLLALVSILHMLFWPALNRSLFALACLGVASRHKLMGALGVFLLAASTGKSLELLRVVIAIFGGK